MRALRNVTGTLAVVLFAVGVNFLMLRETLLTPLVSYPLIGAAVLAVLWFIFWALGAAARDRASAGRGGPLNATFASLFMLGICGMLYAFTARAGWSWDLTQEGRTELAPQTVQVLESLTQPVEVVCFFVKAGDDRVRISQDKTRRFLDRCLAHSTQLQVTFVDPAQQPEQVEKYGAIGVQKSQVGSVLLQAGTRKREIPLSGINARLEERDFTNALINVARDTLPKVYFLMGHGGWDLNDPDPKLGGSEFGAVLLSQSYELGQVAMGPDSAVIPADCDVLVINGYTEDLKEFELQALDQYLSGGGRLLVLINPLVQENPSLPSIERLRPWLESRLGIAMPTNVLISKATSGVQILFNPDFTSFGEFVDPLNGVARFRGSYNADHPITSRLDKVLSLTLVRTVEAVSEPPAGVTQTYLLRSTPDSWAETNIESITSQRTANYEAGDTRGPNPIAMAVTLQSDVDVADQSRAREARAVVVGNAYLSTNDFMKYIGAQDFLLNSMAWLTESEDLIAIRPSGTTEQPLILTRDQQRNIAWIASLSAVQVIAVIGAIILFWRRRYR